MPGSIITKTQGVSAVKTPRIYTITDIHADKTVSSEDWEVAIETARTWFPDAP